MQHYWSLEKVKLQDVWLTIGTFDGVHRGHQAVITKLIQGAHSAGVPAVVLTFHPHPAVVLGKRGGAFYLTPPEVRASLLGESGVDVVITHPFDHQVANLSAYDFIARLHQHLHFSHLCIGHDFALGKGRQGDSVALQQLGEQFGYTLSIVEPMSLDAQVISSSQIRAFLSAGDVQQANKLLGRPYCVSGQIVHGDGRGRGLGIPTANLDIWTEQLIPAVGVYACLAMVNGQVYKAVTNVGVRPTFDDHSGLLRVETHLMDFSGDLYQREMRLLYMHRLRNEKRFENVQALVEQIYTDIDQARKILV